MIAMVDPEVYGRLLKWFYGGGVVGEGRVTQFIERFLLISKRGFYRFES